MNRSPSHLFAIALDGRLIPSPLAQLSLVGLGEQAQQLIDRRARKFAVIERPQP